MFKGKIELINLIVKLVFPGQNFPQLLPDPGISWCVQGLYQLIFLSGILVRIIGLAQACQVFYSTICQIGNILINLYFSGRVGPARMSGMEITEPLPPRPEPEYAGRRAKLRKLLNAAGLDCLLVTHAANRFYLSGFELHDSQPDESSGCLVISCDGNDWLATDSRYLEAAKKLWPTDRILIYSGNSAPAIARLLCRCGGSIGFEAKGLSWRAARALQAHLRPGHSLFAADGLVEKLRMIKEPAEIAALEKSFRLNHQMLDWLKARLDSGGLANQDEKAIAWEIEIFFRENGAQELAFDTIAAIGKNGAMPHAIPGPARLPANAPILIDVGCRVDDYCSDQTRTWWHGPEPSAEFEKTLRLVQAAQEAALAAIKPGVACAAVYKAARQIFIDAGVETAFTHGLGHGVGLQTHEAPSLDPRSTQTLAENMVVTVEPGLYYPEWGGVRWEYTVLVEKNGARAL